MALSKWEKRANLSKRAIRRHEKEEEAITFLGERPGVFRSTHSSEEKRDRPAVARKNPVLQPTS